MSPIAEKISEITALSAVGPVPITTSKYDRLIARAKQVPPVRTVVAHPCDETSLRGPVEAAEAGIIIPIFVGPKEKISVVARTARINIDQFEVVDAPHSDAAAAKRSS
jgi:phosphate acetyltransferase